MAAEHAEREEVEQEQRVSMTGLKQLCGSGETFTRFRQTWSEGNPVSVEEEERQTADELDTAKEETKELLLEQGKILTEIERLAGEAEASELRTKRAVLVEQLKTHAHEWSVLTMALSLLDQARARYEEERQPGVLKNAQSFFKTVTGGAYNRLISPLGTESVSVVAPDGTMKTPGKLSRGTREQLYLALRFGLIQQFGEQETSLPVIVDEVLVNFDPKRARRAAEAFAELARTNQVLVFTCHPTMAELFTEVDPEAKVINISQFGGHGTPAHQAVN